MVPGLVGAQGLVVRPLAQMVHRAPAAKDVKILYPAQKWTLALKIKADTPGSIRTGGGGDAVFIQILGWTDGVGGGVTGLARGVLQSTPHIPLTTLTVGGPCVVPITRQL